MTDAHTRTTDFSQEHEPSPAPAIHLPGAVWSWGTLIAFRFFATYLVLYTFPRALWVLPFTEGLNGLWNRWVAGGLWTPVTRWLGTNVLRNDPGEPGLYDSDYHVALIFTFALLAAAVTVLWTALDRRRSHPKLHTWVSVYLRFTVGLLMVGYGIDKIWLQQFRVPPRPLWLFTPFGAFTPLMTMTAFMGTSPFYQVVTGVIELVAGVLLMIRRTALLGGLLAVAAMLNVAAMNYGFRFGVSLFSTNILVMGLFVVAPDIRWLLQVTAGRQSVPLRVPEPLFAQSERRRIAAIAGVLYLLWAVGVNTRSGYVDFRDARLAALQDRLSGAWDVETFVLNGDTIPPLTTDTTRWRRVILQTEQHVGDVWVQPMQEFPLPLRFTSSIEIDTVSREFSFVWPASNTAIRWRYSEPDSQRLLLGGRWFTPPNAQRRTKAQQLPDSVQITLRRIDQSTLRLLRPVPWISR